jgi:hypothetical protein
MNLKEIILNYITAFNNQDLTHLRLLFDEKIHLHDWKINEKGIENVIKANKIIFNKAPNLNVVVDKKFFFEKIAICILKIKIDKQNTIDVVDVIKVNEEGKIISVRAYKG